MSVCVHVRVHVRVCVLSLHISLFPQQVAKLLSVSPEKANPPPTNPVRVCSETV